MGSKVRQGIGRTKPHPGEETDQVSSERTYPLLLLSNQSLLNFIGMMA